MSVCKNNLELMMRSLDGMLNLVEQRTLEAHLRDCPKCARECELLKFADGLLRAVGAPEVAAEEWPPVLEKMTHDSENARKAIAVAVRTFEPPPVSEGEWSEVWGGIERDALLGEREQVEPEDISPPARKRSIWREAVFGVAACVLVVVGLFLILRQSPVTAPPETKDVVRVGDSYVYTTVATDTDEPVYVITMACNLEAMRASTGSGYMRSPVSGEGGAVEIVPEGVLEEKGGRDIHIEIPLRDDGE